MNRSLGAFLAVALVLSGCAAVRASRYNPFNWFGRSSSQPVAAAGEDVNPLIPRRRASIFRDDRPVVYQGRLIGEVSELLVERRPGGAVIRATGVADRMGPWDVRLVKVDEESADGVLTFDMRNLRQPGPAGGSEWARSVTAAVALSDNDLAGIRTIRVKGARNVRTVRR